MLTCPQGRFSMLTTLKLALQMIKGIESIHEYGYLHRLDTHTHTGPVFPLPQHSSLFFFIIIIIIFFFFSLSLSCRDIKPSNFAMGLTSSKKHTCFFIDFGLSRRFMLPDGEIRPPRDVAGFRGTARWGGRREKEREREGKGKREREGKRGKERERGSGKAVNEEGRGLNFRKSSLSLSFSLRVCVSLSLFRYASIHSHQSRDLGRRDDLWSLFYLMIESVQGKTIQHSLLSLSLCLSLSVSFSFSFSLSERSFTSSVIDFFSFSLSLSLS
jgi:serine/threonine protein kinase